MKTKTIPCHVCDGYGFISKCSENSVSSEICSCCHGKGTEDVPMTNADRIRAMSDEDLAKFLCNIRSKRVTRYSCEGCVAEKFCHDGHTGMADWLQLPAEEGADDE